MKKLQILALSMLLSIGMIVYAANDTNNPTTPATDSTMSNLRTRFQNMSDEQKAALKERMNGSTADSTPGLSLRDRIQAVKDAGELTDDQKTQFNEMRARRQSRMANRPTSQNAATRPRYGSVSPISSTPNDVAGDVSIQKNVDATNISKILH